MTNPYDPWATAIDPGQNPQLSSFWRQRLTMLVPASQTSPVLSLWNAILLVTAASLVFLLPTFVAAPAVAQQESVSQEKHKDQGTGAGVPEPSAAAKSPGKPAERVLQLDGVPDPNYLLLPGYPFLQTPGVRKEVGISDEQEKKLREISAAFEAAQWKFAFTKEMDRLPPQERKAKLEELQAKVVENCKVFRRKIGEVLTTQQWAAYKRHVQARLGSSLLSVRKATSDNLEIRLSQQQQRELDRLEGEKTRNGYEKFRQFADRLQGVLTPEQRQLLAAKFADATVAGPFVHVPIPTNLHLNGVKIERPFVFGFVSRDGASVFVYRELAESDVRAKLALSAEQEAKLRAILVSSADTAQTIFDFFEPMQPAKMSPEEQKSKLAEYRRKLEELGKKLIREIDATLTPEQLASLKKIAGQERMIESLMRPDRMLLEYLHATAEQEAKLRQVVEEYDTKGMESYDPIGDKGWAVLTPEQQKKIEELLDRNGW